ncbi:MAG: IclR family transcriptional regulator [Armatimonadota bacterium]|nr:IclR family transcriptional regulator [Armatimonadota bacterium]MDR7426375.1 IclR family transcriptional regulator [Armatimonadota bacterium]MDR7463327.1 IclR family transcriptional regulator [Armatimonadota bacterium]MDR7469141.1 IclR family transcriptional regulator [Armatimonadota bacterium]MDR7474588.1 IclR family transcriptional regulator [Armatimonadota bacterium]
MRNQSAGARSQVKSLSRAICLLETLRESPEGSTLSTLCQRTSLPKGTAHRLLSTLVEHGFVEQDHHRYRIGVKAFVVGNAFLAHLDLRARALPHLVELRNRSGESVQLAVLENLQVVYIERVLSHSPVAYMKSRVGAMLPAYCTALGKALLAFSPAELVRRYLVAVPLVAQTPHTITRRQRLLQELESVRRRGYAIDRGEREVSVRCIAAPVFNHEGAVAAAVSVAGPAERMPWPLEDSPLAAQVVKTARAISAAVGYAPEGATISRPGPLRGNTPGPPHPYAGYSEPVARRG